MIDAAERVGASTATAGANVNPVIDCDKEEPHVGRQTPTMTAALVARRATMVEGRRYARPLTNRCRGQVPRNYRVRPPTRQDDGQSTIWAISLEFRCLCRGGGRPVVDGAYKSERGGMRTSERVLGTANGGEGLGTAVVASAPRKSTRLAHRRRGDRRAARD